MAEALESKKLLVQSTGLAVARCAIGVQINNLVDDLRSEFSTQESDGYFEARHPEHSNINRLTDIFLLSQRQTFATPHFRLLPSLDAQDEIRRRVTSLCEPIRDIIFEEAQIFSAGESDMFLELIPNEQSLERLDCEASFVSSALMKLARKRKIPISYRPPQVPRFLTIAWANESEDPDVTEEAFEVIYEHLPLKVHLDTAKIIAKKV